jgi:hypothetical protein
VSDKDLVWHLFLAYHQHRSLRPLIVALVPGQQRSLDKLKAMRVHLANEVADLINEFGPKMYENFDEVCVTDSVFVVYNVTFPHDSGAYLYLLQVFRHRPELQGFGDARAELVQLMPKVVCSFTQW